MGALNTQIGSLNAHIKGLNQQLNLAKDRDEDVRRANVEIARRVAELEMQIAANVSKEVLSAKVQNWIRPSFNWRRQTPPSKRF